MTSNNEANAPMVREDGSYPTVPLRKDMIVASVVQTRVSGVDGANPGPDIRRNLDYFLECIDIAQGFGMPSDLLLFHEFPITGFSEWTREQHYELALDIDPKHGRAHLLLAKFLKYNGRVAEAIPHFRSALAIDPGQATDKRPVII